MIPHWHALHVKTRNELKVAKLLESKGLQVYCPVRIEHRQWSDRIKKVKVPLLPSMILVFITEADRSQVFEVPGPLRYLFWSGKPAIISQEEIDTLKKCLDENQITDHELETLSPGDVMNLDTSGFKNTEGIVEKVSNTACWVQLKNLGFILKLNISAPIN